MRTLAEDPDALARHLAEQRTLDLRSPIVRSYLTLLDDAAPVADAQEIQVLVALQVSLRSAGQQIRQAGGGDTGAGEVLSRQLHALQAQMQGADIEVEGALPPRLLAQTLREAWDPGATDQLRLTARHHPEHEGVPVSASRAPLRPAVVEGIRDGLRPSHVVLDQRVATGSRRARLPDAAPASRPAPG